MANLRKINKLVNDASGKYTDKQFFMSSLYLSFLIDMVNTVSKRYNYGERIRLKTVWGGNTVAGTDNRVILINLDNFLCQGEVVLCASSLTIVIEDAASRTWGF